MVERADHSDAGFSDLEQRFFAAAPPEVPVLPPAAPSFDDLTRAPRARRRPPSKGARRSLDRARAAGAPRGRVASTLAFFRRAAKKAGAAARPATACAWRAAQARLAAGRRRVGPALRAARDASARGLRAFVERVLVDLPTDRPDGKTILAATAALIVVFGLSARVLGHAQRTALRTPALIVVAPAAIAAPALAATPPAAAPAAAAAASVEAPSRPALRSSRPKAAEKTSLGVRHRARRAAAALAKPAPASKPAR